MALRALFRLPNSPISTFDTSFIERALSKLVDSSDNISDDETGADQLASPLLQLSQICQMVQSVESIENNEGGSLFHSLRNMQDLREFLSIFGDPDALGQFNWLSRTYDTYTWYGTAVDVTAAIERFKHSVTDNTTSTESVNNDGNNFNTSVVGQDEIGDIQGIPDGNVSTVLDENSENEGEFILDTNVVRNANKMEDGTPSDVAKISGSKSKADRSSFSLLDDQVKVKRGSVSDHAKVTKESISDHAKIMNKSVSDHAKIMNESVSDHAKIMKESVLDHVKVMTSIPNAGVSTVATTDAYGEYFKYRYDGKAVTNTSRVNDVESVSKAIRAVNIQIAVCDSTTMESQTHSRSAYDDMSGNADYYKYRYDEKHLTGYSDTNFETKSDSTQDRYESFRDNNTHFVVDHHNETIAEFNPDAHAPNRYEHIVENDKVYVVDHYNEEVYEDIGCDEEDYNSYFDHSSLDNYEYYTDGESNGEESYWSDGY
jgi:hypothetical protein